MTPARQSIIDQPLPDELQDAAPADQDFAWLAARPPKSLRVVRELTQADIKTIQAAPKPSAPSGNLIKSLRHQHHRLAQLVAAGESHINISLLTGYTPQYIGNLTRNDKAFQALVEHYRGVKELAFVDALERMKGLGLDAMEELQARLTENPGDFSKGELMALTELLVAKPQAQKATASAVAPSVAPTFNITFRAPELTPSPKVIEQ